MSAPTAPQGHRHVHLRREGFCVHSGRFLVGGSTKKTTTLPGGCFFGGDNWNYHPLFTAFRVLSAPVKKTHIYAGFLVFSFLRIQTQNANFQKFRVRFVYEAVKTKLFLNGLFFAPNNLLHVAELSQIFACIINLQASSLESDTALVKKTKKKNHKIY